MYSFFVCGQMRKILVIALLCMYGLFSVQAEVATLIDFARLAPDTPTDAPLDNEATLLRFADLYPTTVGISLTEEEKEKIRISLALPEWIVSFTPTGRRALRLLESDGRHPLHVARSDVRAVALPAGASNYAGQTVMGVRIDFPVNAYNEWAIIEPPFTVPRVNPELASGRGVDFEGLGLLSNVGQIRSISVNVYGLDYQHQIDVLVEAPDGTIESYRVGHVNHRGWKTLTWENPRYVSQDADDAEDDEDGTEGADSGTATAVNASTALPAEPIYPGRFPNYAFRAFRIIKDSRDRSGDFIAYFKDVIIDYDPATDEDEIDHESVWDIVKFQEFRRRQTEVIREGSEVFYRYLQRLGSIEARRSAQ